MAEQPRVCEDIDCYLSYHEKKILKELKRGFPNCELDADTELWDALEDIFYETGERFIFILDEWDSFFHNDFYTDAGAKKYLNFLKNLLKDRTVHTILHILNSKIPNAIGKNIADNIITEHCKTPFIIPL